MCARERQGTLSVEWRWLGGMPFREPFFAETVQLALARPFSLLFPRETGIDELAECEPGLAPNGFIFHMSRCGSTLVTQMLAAVPEFLVLSEPLLVNDVLRAPASEEERVRRLRLAVKALGRPRSGSERAYVLKLDPWATHDLPVIRRAFPETPWIFLSRDPLEVLVSQCGRSGMQMLPTAVPPALFGFDYASAVAMTPEEYGAFVIGALCRQALSHRDGAALFLDYRDLPGSVFDRMLAWFGITCSTDELASMEAASRRDAKNPTLPFADDTDEKARTATPAMHAAVDRWARTAYDAVRAAA